MRKTTTTVSSLLFYFIEREHQVFILVYYIFFCLLSSECLEYLAVNELVFWVCNYNLNLKWIVQNKKKDHCKELAKLIPKDNEAGNFWAFKLRLNT